MNPDKMQGFDELPQNPCRMVLGQLILRDLKNEYSLASLWFTGPHRLLRSHALKTLTTKKSFHELTRTAGNFTRTLTDQPICLSPKVQSGHSSIFDSS